MDEPRMRCRLPAGGNSGLAIEVNMDGSDIGASSNVLPCKEWSITDDVMNVSDSAAFTVANIDGENSSKFYVGQRVELDIADPAVANGQWLRQFTGRVVGIEMGGDSSSGEQITISCMDLGWHLTACKAEPLKNIKSIKLDKLVSMLLDPTWGFGSTQFGTNGAIRNTRLKHGRQVVIQNFKPVLGAILPFIQVEPGQAPFELLKTYAQREGYLINVGARGELIFFKPAYDAPALYNLEYHGSQDSSRNQNNLSGRPSLRKTIDGLFSEMQCWSTVVIPPEIANTENPNEMYRHSILTQEPNPLPFFRREVFSDPEAISENLRYMRALMRIQLGQFSSWEYTATFQGLSQGGALFVSNTMISLSDSVHNVPTGTYYVSAVQKSGTDKAGLTSRLTIRRPVLDPSLGALTLGAGARKAATPPKVVK